jgi:predicted Fe-S protein YdhL (DUF1289 family)
MYARSMARPNYASGASTLDEIRGWKKMTDHRCHQVINDRSRRQAKQQRESNAPL